LLELLKSSSWFTANHPEILLPLLTQKRHEMEFADTRNNWDAIAREKEPAIERKSLCGNRKRREGEKEEESWSSLFSLSLLSCTVSTRTGVSEGEPLQNLRNTRTPEPVFQRVRVQSDVVCTLSISYLFFFFSPNFVMYMNLEWFI
jgi:hypothetical protein